MNTTLFAASDSPFFASVALCVVLAFLGEGLCRATFRMAALKEKLRYAAGTLGVLTGIVFCLSAMAVQGTANPEDLLGTIFLSAVIAGVSGLIWYFALAVLVFGYQHVLAPPFRVLGRWRQRATERNRHRMEELRRQQMRMRPSAPPPAPGPSAAELQNAQKRREDARASCELLYSLYAPELGDRFSRQMFDGFMSKYMTDKHAPNDVERRAVELRTIFEQHQRKVRPASRFTSIEEIAHWFVAEQQRIESLPLPEEIKQEHLAQIQEQYAELTSRFFGSI